MPPQATSTQHYTEDKARLEYLAWRTWFMKQQRSRAAGRRKKVAVEDLPDDSIIDDATTSGALCVTAQQSWVRRLWVKVEA